jgi:hypothetical protein
VTPDELCRNCLNAFFFTSPKPEFLEKFIQIANSKPQPLDDHAIRELAVLMMSTPNYQVC